MSQAPLILIADDEEMLCTVATRILEDEGYRVVAVKDGVECVQKYQEIGPAQIALVILDNVMPRLSGIETFREIRRFNPTARVILSSGSTDFQTVKALLKEGLSGSIPKPYTTADYLKVVRRVLAGN